MVDPYEVPTIFGGLTSSLIADPNTHYHNTSQYGQLLTAMTGSELYENIPEMRDTSPAYVVPGGIGTPSYGVPSVGSGMGGQPFTYPVIR